MHHDHDRAGHDAWAVDSPRPPTRLEQRVSHLRPTRHWSLATEPGRPDDMLLLDVMLHGVVRHHLLPKRLIAAAPIVPIERHIGIGTCGIGIVLMILAAVGGHGRRGEAEKDCNCECADSFHIGNLQVDRAACAPVSDCGRPREICGPPAGTSKLAFTRVNSILARVADRANAEAGHGHACAGWGRAAASGR
jgi:hypothetical protein